MNLERIDDLETAKQVIKLAMQENERLAKRIAELMAEIAELRGKPVPEQLVIELASKQEQLQALQRKVFGESSERRPKAKPPAEREAQRGHGPNEQPDIEHIERIALLPEAHRVCECCGEPLHELPGLTEDSQFISVERPLYFVVKYKRQKYSCKNECTIVTAPNAAKVYDGGNYSIQFGASVAIDKYLDHQPLERQARAMKRAGLRTDSQTLWDQLDGLAVRLQGTYEALRAHVLEADVIGADETWWRLMGKKNSKSRWWAWGITREDACWYEIRDSRSAEAAAQVLEGFSGTVLVDGYKGYESLAKRPGTDIALAHCWAHVRRYFVEAEANYPEACGFAIAKIGELFEIERELPKLAHLEGDARDEALGLREAARRDRSAPIVEALRKWALEQRGLPKGGLRKAIEYMLKLWPGLTTFLEDPRVEIHNNATERALRGMVIGRKNHYGSRSVRGTEVAALFYSLIESAKLCDIDPEAYLIAATHYAMNTGGTLLPHEYARA